MKKYVIYTCIVGGYDEIKQPLCVDDRFDYIFYTDTISENKIGIWEVRPIPFSSNDKTKTSRYVKCLPTVVLNQYEASLYIDGTIQIADKWVYERFLDFVENQIMWGGVNHLYRNCIYDEMITVVGSPWIGVHDFDAIQWYSKLKKEKFPNNYGLYENNIIFRIHNAEVNRICLLWWDTLQHYCKRDQFSLMYILWKNEIKRGFFLFPNEDAIKSNHFLFTLHQKKRKPVVIKFNERVRKICWNYSPWRNESYGNVLEHAYKFPFSKYALYEWEIYAFVAYYLPSKLKNGLKRILPFNNIIII